MKFINIFIMSLKRFEQIILNISFKNLIFICIAKYKKFIRSEYNKYFAQDNIDDMLYKVSQCPNCYLNNSAECCGCEFKEMILTNKKCKFNKF